MDNKEMFLVTLAQKYRPNTFEDIVEQDEVKNKLQEEIKENKLKNAYLFFQSYCDIIDLKHYASLHYTV